MQVGLRITANRLRVLTGEDGDDSPLGDATLAAGRRTAPRVTINAHATETDRSEQNGFANLCRGLFACSATPSATIRASSARSATTSSSTH